MQVSDMKVLLAGYGSIGKRHARILSALGVKTLNCTDPSEASRGQFMSDYPGGTVYADYETALSDFCPDAVFLCTPTKLHIGMAKLALEHKCHVFIEKPLCYTFEGVDEIERLSKFYDRKVMVGFCFRYHEALNKAKKLIGNGEIGRLISIRSLMGEPFYTIHPEYMNMYYSKYSGAFELVHDIDLAIWFAGQPIKQSIGLYGSLSEMGMSSPDTIELLIEFEDRLIANVHLDFFQTPRRRTIDLIGWDGTIQVEFSSWDYAQLRLYSKKTNQWIVEEFKTERDDMFIAEDSEFLNCVCDNLPVRLDIAEACKTVRVMSDVYKDSP